jgi:hypothetical protein
VALKVGPETFFGVAANGLAVFGREGSSYVFLQQRAPTLQVSPHLSLCTALTSI